MTAINRFDEFFAAYQDCLTEDDHIRLWGRSRRESARALYDHLVAEAERDDEASLRAELYRFTCRLCGAMPFGEEYTRAAIGLCVAETRARAQFGEVDEARAGRVLLEHHDCREYSDYRPGDLVEFKARAVLDPEPMLAVIRGYSRSAVTPDEVEEVRAEIRQLYTQLNASIDREGLGSESLRRIIDAHVRLSALVAGVRL